MKAGFALGLVACGGGSSAPDAADGTDGPLDAAPVPVTLVSGLEAPWRIAVDGAGVYWAEEPSTTTVHSLWRANLDGGAPLMLTTTNVCTLALGIDQVVSDAQHVYWTQDCAVCRVDKLAGGAEQCGTGANGASHVAVDAASVYTLTATTLAVAPRSTLAFTDRVTGLDLPLAIAIAGDTLYFATFSVDDGTIFSMPNTGSTPTAIAMPPWTSNLVATDDAAYWIRGNISSTDDDALVRWDRATGQTTSLGPVRGGRDLVVDGADLFWIENTPNEPFRIMRAPIDGGAAPRLVYAEPDIAAIAVYAGDVYWANFTDGVIRRIRVH